MAKREIGSEEDERLFDEYLASLTDDNITDQTISELKSQGVTRPPNVSFNRWTQPFDLSPRHLMIIQLTVMGLTPKQVASELGYSTGRMDQLLKMPKIKAAVDKKRDEYFGDSKKTVKALVAKAYKVVDGILDDENEKSSVRLDAAKYVIDQTVGKANQSVTVSGDNLLVDFISKLDQAAKVMRDVAATEGNLLAAPADPMDALVDDIIDAEFVVGKRNG